MKRKLYVWLFGEYNPQEDTKYLVAFLLTILFIIFVIWSIGFTRDFRKEACIEREMACGHVSREVAEEITESRWFYF